VIRRLSGSLALGLMAASTFFTPALAARPHDSGSLTGAGSTFVYPFFSKAFAVYQAQKGVSVNYQSIGSGGGIAQFSAGTVDFGASDVPMNPSEIATAVKKGGTVVQIPVALGGESLVYNLPGIKTGLHLSGGVIAQIYLGSITKWNDKAIRSLNPKLKLPSLQIVPAHRSDGSGTTYIFTDYLSKVSDQWRGQVGTGKAVNFPGGVGGKGNEGVAASVQQTPGALGYVELAYALQTHLKQAALENRSHKFVTDSIASVRAAATTLSKVSPTHFSIVDAKGAKSYPICGYTWAMVFKHQTDSAKGKTLVHLLQWVTSTGQKYAANLDYVPLPKNIQGLASTQLKTVK
jgi:phosphate transport system substrate-binding protein